MTPGETFTAPELATVTWRISTRSGSGGGGNCVEVGVLWRTSSRSGSAGGSNCVEVGAGDERVLVRDSKDRAGGLVAVSPVAWAAFTGAVRGGRLAG